LDLNWCGTCHTMPCSGSSLVIYHRVMRERHCFISVVYLIKMSTITVLYYLKNLNTLCRHKHIHASVGVDVSPCTSVFPPFDKKITSLNLMMKFINIMFYWRNWYNVGNYRYQCKSLARERHTYIYIVGGIN